MKSKLNLLTGMYWLFKIWFGVQLFATLFIVAVNYVDWLSPIMDKNEKLTYTVRGYFGLKPTSGFRPDKNFDILNASSYKDVIALRSYGGWARVDYSSFSSFSTVQNWSWMICDATVWLCWLLILFLVMKLLGNAREQQIFSIKNVNYLRLIALFTGLSGYFEAAKEYLFTVIISKEITWDGFTVFVKGSVKTEFIEYSIIMLLIFVIAEFVKQGVVLKNENDLTI
jgi:hypothetical protein